jgi:hypothetical protein
LNKKNTCWEIYDGNNSGTGLVSEEKINETSKKLGDRSREKYSWLPFMRIRIGIDSCCSYHE